MNKFPRILRITVATIVFIIITCGFLTMSGGNQLSQALLRTQFVPSLVSIFTGSALAFILLVLATLLFGRVYCSFLCPLGIWQDIVIRISDFTKKRSNGGKAPKKEYKKPHNIFRYTVLVIIGGAFAAGFTYPLALLDPYSYYGHIVTNVFGSLETLINNLLSAIFPASFYTQNYSALGTHAFIWAIIFFVVVTLFSVFKGRLYCNTICPVGSLLGLLGGISLFKPAINKDMCVKCGQCARKCKSNCINLETKEIDATRCVACYDCIVSCKRGGVKLVPTWFKKEKKEFNRDIENKERRNAIIAMGGFAAALAARKFSISKSVGSSETVSGPIMPPGARNLAAFKDNCTACHACVAACPNGVIKPASFEYGIDGIMLPTLKYDRKYCSYECNLCSQTCSHGALEHISLEEKKKTQIALAVYDPSTCVIIQDGVNCGACSRSCPAGAIEMKENPIVPGQFLPSVNSSLCIGCGACEYACPAMPKAIMVKGKTVQTRA
ncbi:MAG: 4Fe-4S binding protein, partial [Bacteroidales bacterium]|nr:4Fe-4S binding protein [Bacteroidales bacterium]